jgi:biopolymer transport protein ExbB
MDYSMTIQDLFDKGGPIVWVLAAYSMLGLAIVLERLLYFARLRPPPAGLLPRLNRLLESGQPGQALQQAAGPEMRVIRAVVEAFHEGVQDLRGVGLRVRAQEMQRMEFGLPTLGVLGNTAPLLGLLGTITGMMASFQVIEQAGGKVNAQALAGGIWEAMITTGVGLAVAIPLVILLHLLEGMVERRVQSLDRCIALLLERRSEAPPDNGPAPEVHHYEEITDGV